MKQVTVGFSRASTSFPIFSWLIMLTEHTPYSHVYIRYQDNSLGCQVYHQASHSLVNTMGAAVFLGQEKVIQEFNFEISDAAFLAIRQFALANAGKPYGTVEILGLAWVQLWSFFGIKKNNPFKNAGSTWICDQFIAEMLASCVNVVLPTDVNNMTPKDVFALVSTLPTTLT